MAEDGNEELRGVLSDVARFATSLEPDLLDKKTISDALLAIEKIQPELAEKVQPKVARLGAVLGGLYEKFLMEMVDDGGPGLAKTIEGIDLIGAALAREKPVGILDNEADAIARVITDTYALSVEEAPPTDSPDESEGVPQEEEPGDEGTDDDFFTGPAPEPHQPFATDDENDEPPNELSAEQQKLSKLAGIITMMEPDMRDKKEVSDLILAFDEIAQEHANAKAPDGVIAVANALSAIFEESLMTGLADGARALELATEGVKALEAHLDALEDPASVGSRGNEVADQVASELGLTFDRPGGGDAPPVPAAQPIVESSSDAPPPGEELHAAAHALAPTTITVATEDDLLLYSEFVTETSDTIATVEEGLLELEENPNDDELINMVFRAFHSLKGAAGFLGLSTVNVLCHECETLLDKLRKHILPFSQPIIDTFLVALDTIKVVNDLLGENCRKVRESLPDVELELPRYGIDDVVNTLIALGKEGTVVPPPATAKSAMAAAPDDEGDAMPEMLGDILVKKKIISEEQLDSALNAQKPVGTLLVEMGAVQPEVVQEALVAQDKARRSKKASSASLKVDTEKLDSLLELVGELVITQSIIAQDDVLGSEINRSLQKNLGSLGKIIKNIQDHVMSLRMIPVRQMFQKMSRLARDLSKKMKRPVHLTLEGVETEIDKTLVEELSDPMVHLMRNAIDHGIEASETRKNMGKSPTGQVKLAAYHKGGNVYIELTDDGAGINVKRVREKAIEKGLITADQELSDNELHNLIIQPGFSTAAQVTDVSGRGVGMDVVRSNIDKLGGRLEITSAEGRGSTFTIKLPLTMAIVDGMIVRIGAERFIIPTISIRESVRPSQEEISTVRHDAEMIHMRGRLLPLIRLHNILKVADPEFTKAWQGLVIIVESDDREYGLLVDDLLGQQQVVVKTLGERFKGLPGISGGTILGDGQVGLILDVAGAISMN